MSVNANDFSPTVQTTLYRLATTGDRTAPVVFAGREAECALLDEAVDAVRYGESGRTVVIQGVPGAGKTALLGEYAVRLLTGRSMAKHSVVPVSLRPDDLDDTPMAILEELDRQFCESRETGRWGGPINRMLGAANIAGNAVFAALTKRHFSEFKASARAPKSLPVALDEYVSFRFDRRDSTVLLMVDEAQNQNDTLQVRRHLDALHGGLHGRMKVLLACFGLANTTDRLRQLGLSRLASGHSRSIGVLSGDEAKQTVMGTLERAFADCTFDGGQCDESQRSRWIESAAAVILTESGNFPQHLTNGCRALAKIVLDQGIGDNPPIDQLRDQCRECKREYYDARLHPWSTHTTALAHAFAASDENGWTPIEDVLRTLMASDNHGKPVAEDAACSVFDAMCASGYIDEVTDYCRPALPSMASHLEMIRSTASPRGKSVRAIRAVLPSHDDGGSFGRGPAR